MHNELAESHHNTGVGAKDAREGSERVRRGHQARVGAVFLFSGEFHKVYPSFLVREGLGGRWLVPDGLIVPLPDGGEIGL